MGFVRYIKGKIKEVVSQNDLVMCPTCQTTYLASHPSCPTCSKKNVKAN